MLKNLRLAAHDLWRDIRRGEWLIIFFALVLAVGASTALHFYIDRLVHSFNRQGAKVLGGDLVISSPNPLPLAWIQKAASLNLHTAEVWLFSSVVRANNRLQMVEIEAVSPTFPILGPRPNVPDRQTIWVESRLLPLLSVAVNDNVIIGASTFRIAQILTADIEMLSLDWSIAPKVLMQLVDVPLTKTVMPGSRVEYRLLLTGDKNRLSEFQTWITPQLTASQRVLDVQNQQFVLRDILRRSTNYLELILLVCMMMGGVAIALSAQQYLRRHYSQAALWRSLGARSSQIFQVQLYKLTIIGLTAGLLGAIVGYVAQEVFHWLFKDIFTLPIGIGSYTPIFFGLITSLSLLFLFTYPTLSQLPNVPPLFIWREEYIPAITNKTYFITGFTAILLFVYFFTDFSLLTLFLVNALLLSVALLYGVSIVLLTFLRKLLAYLNGSIRRGLSQLVYSPDSTSIQFIGFTLIVMLLMVLSFVRSDLVVEWKKSLPEKTPNYFVVNIGPNDLPQFKHFLQQKHIYVEGIYPMVRGRLVILNKRPIKSAIPPEAQNHNALQRELNLSAMDRVPSDNKIVEGKDWKNLDPKKNWVSVESKLGKDLNLHVGDELTFQMGDEQFSAIIANFRTLNWSTFKPNFFMIFSPGTLDRFPSTYITSFYLSTQYKNILNELIQLFPNVTVIDVANLLQQIQALLSKVLLAMQYLFLFALSIGVLVFLASLEASLDDRRQVYSLLRILGAGRRFILTSIIVEFGCFFLLIVVTAWIIAKLLTFILMRTFFGV